MTGWINLKRSISQERLNAMYSTEGYYWYLHSPEFISAFVAPLGHIIQKLGKNVLDIGCGEGWLKDFVGLVPYRGIDASEEAIRKAKQLRPEASFEVARFEDYVTDMTFGTVVFGNMLWLHVHKEDYVKVLQRYETQFKPSYIIVYDLSRLDTSDIDAHYKLIEGFQATADVQTIEPIKRTRQVKVYACE